MAGWVRLTLAAAATLVLLGGCGDNDSQAPDIDQADRNPVVVIGVDGAEWQVIEDMVEDGELPGFGALMEEGAYGHLLNPGPQVSPVVWTTFSTGHFGREHGILDFVFPFTGDGEKSPVDVSLRRQPALWNILDAQDRSSTVIGYFVSHPAEPINGAIISDRAFQGLEQSTWPQELESVADRVRKSVRDDKEDLYARFLRWSYDPDQAENESSPYHQAARIVRGRVDSWILSDEFLRRMTMELLDRDSDLFVTYFRIVDIFSHSLWYFYDDSDWDDEGPFPEQRELLGGVLEESYRYVDEVIQDVLERYKGRANILVFSDHGFGSATGSYRSSNDMLTGNHRPNGVILAHGPDIAEGQLEPTTIMEVFPTLANLLGIPIADTVPGNVEYGLLSENFSDKNPPEYIDRYDIGWRPVDSQEVDSESQREEMDSLRGLGYIGEGVTLSDGAGDRGAGFWSADAKLIVRTLHGDATYYLLQDDISAADEVANELLRNAPHLMPQFLARVRAKIHSFRRDVPGGEDLAPGTEAFVERHQGSGSQ